MPSPYIKGVDLAVGKRATAIGYGAMQEVEVDERGESMALGDFRFDLYGASGEIRERFPNNDVARKVRTPGPWFSASRTLPEGMSGSPIFDDERIYVHGVVSSRPPGCSG